MLLNDSLAAWPSIDESEFPALKAYWSLNWVCTDTGVGLRFYFLNDEFIGASFQPARKSDEEFQWVSQEAFDKCKEYILGVYINHLKKNDQRVVNIINMNEDVSDIKEYSKNH